MNVLLDLNVLLDVFLDRKPWVVDASAVFEANRDGRVAGHVSAAAVPTLFYVVRRHSGTQKAGLVVDEALASFAVVPVGRSTILLARALAGPDFEDDLHGACARELGLDAIVTRDPRGFSGWPVAVQSPPALIARIPGPPAP